LLTLFVVWILIENESQLQFSRLQQPNQLNKGKIKLSFFEDFT